MPEILHARFAPLSLYHNPPPWIFHNFISYKALAIAILQLFCFNAKLSLSHTFHATFSLSYTFHATLSLSHTFHAMFSLSYTFHATFSLSHTFHAT
jgi:hypothetical protein